jgi:hypothetical protein
MNPCLLFLPATILVAVIVLRVDTEFAARFRSRWVTLIGLGVAMIVLAWFMARPENVSLGILVLPYVAIGLAGFLIHAGFNARPHMSRWRILGGLSLLSSVALAMAELAGTGGLAPALAFVVMLAAIGVAVVIAVWFVWTLPGRRKAAGLLFAVVFPAGLYLSILVG